MKIKFFILTILIAVLSLNLVYALDTDRNDRLSFGYVLDVINVSTEPINLIPGQDARLFITIANKAVFPLYDLRVSLALPTEIALNEDISKRKITQMNPSEVKVLSYNIIALPSSNEGVYNARYSINYLNHVATEREENDSFGIVIKSKPKLFSEIERAEIYVGNEIGDVTINFVNNDLSNIKFLTVELMNSPNYEILSSGKKYIGDLDSDDFSSVDFRIKVNQGVREVDLPLKVFYKDVFNNNYVEEITQKIVVKNSEELGIKPNYTFFYIIVIAIVLVVVFIVVKIIRGRRRHERK